MIKFFAILAEAIEKLRPPLQWDLAMREGETNDIEVCELWALPNRLEHRMAHRATLQHHNFQSTTGQQHATQRRTKDTRAVRKIESLQVHTVHNGFATLWEVTMLERQRAQGRTATTKIEQHLQTEAFSRGEQY